jgi:hypothetical protein
MKLQCMKEKNAAYLSILTVVTLCSLYLYFLQLRAQWYVIAAISDDERARRVGYLSVVYSVQVDIASLFKRHVSKVHEDIGRTTRMRECLPMRPSAIHFCYNDIRLRPLISIYKQLVGTHGRVRCRTHFGSHTECQYALMSFGIMPDCLPVDTEGNKNCVSLNQWIEKRKILESERDETFLHRSQIKFGLDLGTRDLEDISQLEFELSKIKKKPAYDKAKFLWPTSVTDPSFCLHFIRAADSNPREAARLLLESLPRVDIVGGKLGMADLMLWLEKRKKELQAADPIAFCSPDNTDVIYFPSSNDILLGSGFAYQNFPGNQYFISFVKLQEGTYDDAGPRRLKKTAISEQVVKSLQASGSRFLQRAGNKEDGWVHVDDHTARKKVSHAFRNLRRRDAT